MLSNESDDKTERKIISRSALSFFFLSCSFFFLFSWTENHHHHSCVGRTTPFLPKRNEASDHPNERTIEPSCGKRKKASELDAEKAEGRKEGRHRAGKKSHWLGRHPLIECGKRKKKEDFAAVFHQERRWWSIEKQASHFSKGNFLFRIGEKERKGGKKRLSDRQMSKPYTVCRLSSCWLSFLSFLSLFLFLSFFLSLSFFSFFPPNVNTKSRTNDEHRSWKKDCSSDPFIQISLTDILAIERTIEPSKIASFLPSFLLSISLFFFSVTTSLVAAGKKRKKVNINSKNNETMCVITQSVRKNTIMKQLWMIIRKHFSFPFFFSFSLSISFFLSLSLSSFSFFLLSFELTWLGSERNESHLIIIRIHSYLCDNTRSPSFVRSLARSLIRSSRFLLLSSSPLSRERKRECP